MVDLVPVHDHRKRIDTLAVDQHVQPGEIRRLETIEAIVEGSVATADRFQPVEKIQHDFGQRDIVDDRYLNTQELHVFLHAALLHTQRDHATQVILGHQDITARYRFTHLLDITHVG